MSLTATLGALGLALVVVEDLEQFEHIRGRLATPTRATARARARRRPVETPPSERRHAKLYTN